MMNKMALIAACALLSSVAIAQPTSSQGVEQQIFYKWYVNGIAHYAKTPPRETRDYVRINQFGMLMKDRPNVDSFQVIKPMRPHTDEMNTNGAEDGNRSIGMPEGTISKDKRCKLMREELKALETKKDIYQEDESGNLIPLDSDEIEARKQDMRDTIERVCES